MLPARDDMGSTKELKKSGLEGRNKKTGLCFCSFCFFLTATFFFCRCLRPLIKMSFLSCPWTRKERHLRRKKGNEKKKKKVVLALFCVLDNCALWKTRKIVNNLNKKREIENTRKMCLHFFFFSFSFFGWIFLRSSLSVSLGISEEMGFTSEPNVSNKLEVKFLDRSGTVWSEGVPGWTTSVNPERKCGDRRW